MAPFSLHCTTCKAALRVTNRAAIGQILPCPKCGSMVQVVPPLEAEELERGLADKEAWQQEYLCEFTDGSSVLLPYELIAKSEHPEATEQCAPEDLQRGLRGHLFAGIDFGRKKHLTVCWILHKVGQEIWTREVITFTNMSTPDQFNALRPHLQKCSRICVDYTGAGVGLGDLLAKTFQEWSPGTGKKGRVELCQFTAALKANSTPSSEPPSKPATSASPRAATSAKTSTASSAPSTTTATSPTAPSTPPTATATGVLRSPSASAPPRCPSRKEPPPSRASPNTSTP